MRSRCRAVPRTDPTRTTSRVAIVSVAIALAALTSACTGIDAAEAPDAAESRPGGTATVSRASDGAGRDRTPTIGQFVAICPFSHRSPDDPIVHPHEDGHEVSSAHSHDFYGNESTDAHSTPKSLLGASTNCTVEADLSAYWTPTLFRAGSPVTAEQFVAYYDTAPGIDPSTALGLPAGLMMIAGNDKAIGAPPDRPMGWTCGTSTDRQMTAPMCPFTAPLTLHLTFPDCWDGQHLDSDDHRSHVAYSTDGRCPPEQPIPMIRLLLRVRYPVYGDPSDITLSSGPTETAHADFVNAWTDKAMTEFMDLCIRRRVICGEA